jgi:hypothetical protein
MPGTARPVRDISGLAMLPGSRKTALSTGRLTPRPRRLQGGRQRALQPPAWPSPAHAGPHGLSGRCLVPEARAAAAMAVI